MTTATIGPVTLKGAYNVSDDGGMQSPDMTVDKSFDYSSYVQRQPVEASVSAVVHVEDELKSLRKLREQKQPVGFSAGQVSIESVKITNLSVEQDAAKRSHVEATIDVTEVFTASVETTSAVVELPGDGGGSVSGGGSSLPSLVDTESDSEGGSGPPSDSQSSPTSSSSSSQSASDSPTGNDGGGGDGGGIIDSAISAAESAVDSTANALASVTPGDGII
jgi:hypothetical protein